VQDVGAVYEDIAAYADLANRGELTVRVYAMPAEGGWYDQAKLGLHRAFGSPWLRIGGVRALFDPAHDSSEMQTRLMAADHAGLQLNVSGVGEAPAGPRLHMLDAIARANGGRDRRFRFAATRIPSVDVSRLSTLNAVAVLRPAAGGAPPASLRESGIRVALGSGWPSSPLNPMATLAAAIDAGATTAEALEAATSGSAFAEFQEGEKGTISRGQRADMVILSGDILAVPVSQLKQLTVLTTIVGGKIVHQRKP
jgi:predicted amidohydrolase YtcJ